MLVTSLILSGIAVVLAVLIVVAVLGVRKQATVIEDDLTRLRALLQEWRGLLQTSRKIAVTPTEAVGATSAAVDLGTNIVQTSHQLIASIPFAVLDAVPATRPASKVVRAIHDETANGVYAAIRGINGAIRSAIAGTAHAASHVAEEIAQVAEPDQPIQATARRLDTPVAELAPVAPLDVEPVDDPDG